MLEERPAEPPPAGFATVGDVALAYLEYARGQYAHDPRELDLIVPIGPRSQRVLRPYLNRPDDQPCFSPRESERQRYEALRSNGRRVRAKVKGTASRRVQERYTTDSYRRAIQYAGKKVGVPVRHPHQLRHTVATRLRAKYGLEAAQVYLGHSSADITQVYAERNLATAVRIARDIG